MEDNCVTGLYVFNVVSQSGPIPQTDEVKQIPGQCDCYYRWCLQLTLVSDIWSYCSASGLSLIADKSVFPHVKRFHVMHSQWRERSLLCYNMVISFSPLSGWYIIKTLLAFIKSFYFNFLVQLYNNTNIITVQGLITC